MICLVRPPKPQAARHAPLLLTIVALGCFLRLYQIDGKGLWIDEAFSIWLSQQPVDEMLAWIVRIDQHPPLYYTLLHFWIILGNDPVTTRALSALCGTLTIPVIYLLGRRLDSDKVGLLAALLLAVSPFHVRAAQETRMYALLALNGALALYAFACLLLPRPPAFRINLPWLGTVLFSAAALLTHNTAIFLPIAANLLVLGLALARRCGCPRMSTFSLRAWLTAQLGVFLLWMPWLPAFVFQSIGVYRGFWLPAPTWETVVGTVGMFLCDLLPLPLAGLCAVGALYVGLIALGLIRFRRQPLRMAFLLVIFATPLVGEWLISLRRPIFHDRSLIWASLPLYLLLAAGVRRLRRRTVALVIVLTLLAFNGLSLWELYTHTPQEEWDEAAAFVAQQVEAGDLILFNATWAQIPFDYYFHPLYNGPVTEHGAPADLFEQGVLEPKMTEHDLARLRALTRGRERVWLVYSHNWYTDPLGLIPSTLGERLVLLEQKEFYHVEVRLYGER